MPALSISQGLRLMRRCLPHCCAQINSPCPIDTLHLTNRDTTDPQDAMTLDDLVVCAAQEFSARCLGAEPPLVQVACVCPGAACLHGLGAPPGVLLAADRVLGLGFRVQGL